MIDIETLGINPDSVVLTIGAIKFQKDEDCRVFLISLKAGGIGLRHKFMFLEN